MKDRAYFSIMLVKIYCLRNYFRGCFFNRCPNLGNILTCRCFLYSKTGSKTEFTERIKIHKLRLMIILLQICDGFVVVLPLHVSSSQSVLTNLAPGLTPELPCALSGDVTGAHFKKHARPFVSEHTGRALY